MATGRSLEARLARVRQLRSAPPSPQVLEDLRRGLRDASNLVCAEAAEIVGEARLTELAGDLVEAFARFLDNPAKKDKQCRAKIALVEALNKMEVEDEDFFVRGIGLVQEEPVWGGSRDTAVPVRVACAFALVRLRHRGALPLLIDLLVDPEKGARVGAVQALACSATDSAYLLLRLKARFGDPDTEVISECLGAILQLNPEQGVPFVAAFLDAPQRDVQEAALLALGSSRRPEAFEALRSFAERHSGDLHEVACVALALLRHAPATDFLLGLAADPSPELARSAVAALAVQRYDPRVRERVAAAVAARDDPALHALFEKRFRTAE